ncbi:TPA: hypothetical protein EYP44_01060 [Candidatus Bathyarchaeota archaeon]|nr:hypothetical protein [Candidatus Bathyarchaeota archaeon]
MTGHVKDSSGEAQKSKGQEDYTTTSEESLEKKAPEELKEIGEKERRKVDQQLHIVTNQVIEHVKQFPKPVIAMEDLKGLRKHMNFSKRMNRRVHSMPYRKLQSLH